MNDNLSASIFIMRLQKLIAENKLIFKPRNRQKTMQFLFDEGLSVSDVLGFVKELRPENFYSGPTADDNGSAGDVMVFLQNYKDTKLYIKLKIWTDKNGDAGVVMSFHKEGQYD
ncbi:type II toxin-antitoxin system MqsR family toxin [Treponema zioleckii]|uniref:type II toxin-antitoxin system MqsR family toxin n=1 Tax=Treponema zioleckii TaxID=331680 RepID=UPI00168AB099|nr:type II toxin-antitoxin system MqsR family toxin [Treponema zioleckii]